MVDNGKGWNQSLVQSLFNLDLEISGAIVATPISWTDKEDEVCWSHNKSSKFSVKSGYECALKFLYSDSSSPNSSVSLNPNM